MVTTGHEFVYIPYAPCMEYLPTFGSLGSFIYMYIDIYRVNVGKYSIHGASGYLYTYRKQLANVVGCCWYS